MTIAPDGPVAFALTLLVGLITGFVVSRTVIVNDFGAALLPAGSCALQVIVVVPTGKIEPELSPLVGDEVQMIVICAGGLVGSVAVTE